MEGKFIEGLRNLLGSVGGDKKLTEKPRRENEGGKFMAVPGDQKLGTTEEEADIIAANRKE